jgi:hypothetical protein
MWRRHGKTLFFVSDRSGLQNIWSLAPEDRRARSRGSPGQADDPADGRMTSSSDFESEARHGLGAGAKVPITRRAPRRRLALEHVS